MKKFIIVSAVAAMATMSYADDASVKAELEALKAQVAELKKNQEAVNLKGLSDQVKELKVRTGGDNVKWDVDYRASYDMVDYKNNDGSKYSNGVLTNRLWLGAKAAPRNDLSFIGQLAYNKVFGDTANKAQTGGARDSYSSMYFANYDWFTSEKSSDNTVKVKTAYAIYFGNLGNVPYTASIGRRPSTNGLMVNMRDDDPASSPIGHSINVEFDGASFKFDLDKVTGVPGMSFKLCMGRALTNATPYLSSGSSLTGQPDFTSNKALNKNIDMFGFIYVPYDDGQYSIHAQAAKAWNLIGFTGTDISAFQTAYMNYQNAYASYMGGTGATSGDVALSGMAMQGAIPAFKTVGNMYLGSVSLLANGIGSGISDFLDNTTAFVSWSATKTDPNNKYDGSMLGSTKGELGQSWYAGVQMPAMITSDGKIGLEYNQGSKYWRSFTYGEDTMIGSKLAARGRAYEAYYTQPILGSTLSGQIRLTHIDYDYSGSNMFFGDDGTPYKISEMNPAMGQFATKTANDIRAYLRYRY